MTRAKAIETLANLYNKIGNYIKDEQEYEDVVDALDLALEDMGTLQEIMEICREATKG